MSASSTGDHKRASVLSENIHLRVPKVALDQREALLDFLNSHGHSAFEPEVRSELLTVRGRGGPLEPQEAMLDEDGTMLVD